MLESSPKTADMVDLFKYLLYKATDKSYGVETFDFTEYGKTAFTVAGSEDALTEFISRQENNPLWEFLYENGDYNYTYVRTHVSQDKQYFYMRPDDYLGPDQNYRLETNRNYGFGLLIYAKWWSDEAQMYKEAYNNEALFKKYGYDITSDNYDYTKNCINGNMSLSEFDEKTKVKVSDAMAIKKEIIEAKIQQVKDAIPSDIGLNQAQFDTLVDIYYQYGSIDFVTPYRNNYRNGSLDYEGFFAACSGFHPDGSTAGYRSDARQELFKNGRYTYLDTDGQRKEIKIKTASTSSNTGTTSNVSGNGSKIVAEAKRLINGDLKNVTYASSRTIAGYWHDYRCSSFVAEVIYNVTKNRNLANGTTSPNTIFRAMNSDTNNFKLIYYKLTNHGNNSTASEELNSNVGSYSQIDFQPGDILGTYSNEYRWEHSLIYGGGNDIIDNTGAFGNETIGRPSVHNGFSAYDETRVKYVFRYIGN